MNALKEETLTIKTEIEDLAEVEVVDTMTEDKTKIVVSKTVEVTEKTVDLVVIKEEVSKNEITTIVEEIVISTIAEETVVSTNLKMIMTNPIY